MKTKTRCYFITICLGLMLVTTVQAGARGGDIDNDMAHWQKEHALYVHDVRLSSLDQEAENGAAPGFAIARHLIDAALYVAYAEADRLELKKTKLARKDLGQALQALAAADALASDKDKLEITALEQRLMTIRDLPCRGYGLEAPATRKGYDTLRQDMGRLAADLGENAFYSSLLEQSRNCHRACG